jgi:hypothetical protein
METQLIQDWKKLEFAWKGSNDHWKDDAREEFERKYWARIEDVTKQYLRALEQLSEAVENR